MIVYCQAHGGSHYLRSINRALTDTHIKTVMCKPRRDFPLDGSIALVRDPRDRIISQYRYWEKRNSGKALGLSGGIDEKISAMLTTKDGKEPRKTYAEATEYFINIIKNCNIIHFENLVRGGPYMQHFLELLGSSDNADDVYAKAFGNSRTYTGNFSDHKNWYGQKCYAYWEENKHLLEALGYND